MMLSRPVSQNEPALRKERLRVNVEPPVERRRPVDAPEARGRPARTRRSVLVLGDHRQSLAVARSLHRAGYRVIAGRDGHRTILERSRCVAEVWDHPPASDRAAWGQALETFCRRRVEVRAVFPVGAHEIDLAVPLAARFPVLIVAASPEALAVCRSKRAMLALADRAGVPTRPWEVVGRPADLDPAFGRIGLPAVLKPDLQSDHLLDFKALVVRTAPDARRVLETSVFPACGFVLQRLAPGTRHNVYFIAREGRLLGCAQVRITRTDRPDGTGLAVQGCSVAPDPALLAWTEVLVQRLSYTGAGCAQFMVDASADNACFLEINARLGANCAAVCACGLDLPCLFLETLAGAATAQAPAIVGRRYAWLEGDLHGLASCLAAGRLSWGAAAPWLACALMAQLTAHDQITWSWRDPLPTLAIVGRLLHAAVRKATGGR